MARGRIMEEPTEKQVKGVDNILSGRYPSATQALRAAGYSKHIRVGQEFYQAAGVQLYLKTISKVAKKRWNYSLPDKVMLTYLDGLEATKRGGRDADVEYPDWLARKAFADKFAEFFGWTAGSQPSARLQQFNFFSVGEEERKNFNENFKKFLKQM